MANVVIMPRQGQSVESCIITTWQKKKGDRVEVGCNSVLNPGTVIGRDSNIYPTSCVRGTVPEKSIWKNNGKITAKHE